MSRRSVRKALALCFAAVAVALSPSLLRPDALVITRAMLATTVSEIFLYDGTSTIQLTNSPHDSRFPKINANGHVVWIEADYVIFTWIRAD